MKLNYKVLLFLTLCFISVFIISVFISINILISNQKNNIKIFKNEFITENTEYSDNESNTFFKNFEYSLNNNSSSIEKTKKYFKGDIILIFDLNGNMIFSTPEYENKLYSLISKDSLKLKIRNLLIQEKNEFEINNFNDFINDKTSNIVPTTIYFHLYENNKILAAYFKESRSISTRIKYIERFNNKELKKYLTIYIITFLIFLSIIFLAILLLLNKIIINPITLLSEHFGKIINGSFNERIEIKSNDEIGQLTSSFNFMTDKIQQSLEYLENEIFERIKAEKLLADEKEELSVTLRSIGDGVITTDKTGKVVLINKVAEILTGWTQIEASGKDLTDVFNIINEKTRETVLNPVTKVLEEGKIVGLANHTILISKSGKEIMIDDSAAPIYDAESKIIGVVLVFRNVTDKRKMEENLLRTIKLESIGLLAGGIAHDFNNILTAILGNISLAKYIIEEDNSAYEIISEAEKASIRAKSLSNQLLSLSKGGKPVISTSSIRDLLEEAANFVLHGSKITCNYDIPGDVWNVKCDEGQIIQVIHNLVINARQAMPDGGHINISCENIINSESSSTIPLSSGDYVKILVKDEGIGISKENILKIFDPYFTTKENGQGIGLATTYSIIQKHSGYIEVKSEVNKGSCFSFYLPASQNGVDVKKKNYEISKIKNLKILVLEDEENIIKLLSNAFKDQKHFLTFTKDGIETIEKYKKSLESPDRYDLLILDLTIPGGMGGKETFLQLKMIDPNITAIVSSGYSNDSVIANYKEYGFKSYLTKPYKIEDLNKIIYDIFMKK